MDPYSLQIRSNNLHDDLYLYQLNNTYDWYNDLSTFFGNYFGFLLLDKFTLYCSMYYSVVFVNNLGNGNKLVSLIFDSHYVFFYDVISLLIGFFTSFVVD